MVLNLAKSTSLASDKGVSVFDGMLPEWAYPTQRMLNWVHRTLCPRKEKSKRAWVKICGPQRQVFRGGSKQTFFSTLLKKVPIYLREHQINF